MTIASRKRIPVINLNDYLNGDAQAKARFVQTWGDGLKEFGFVAVEGHAIDSNLIRTTYDLYRQFFALSTDVKEHYGNVSGGQRGYTSFGKEHAKDSKVGDLKEFWHVGRELTPDLVASVDYPPNVWPTELPMFREANLTLYAQLESTAKVLMRALADYFELPDRAYFDKAIEGGNSILRAIHYPPLLPHHDPRAVRAAAHEDINLITILCEATSSGLEILTREGDWMAIDALEGQLVVDAGDMLSRLTNNVIPATTHRVVNPEGENTARYSMPFFVHPTSDFNIECLTQCETPDQPAKYPPITAGEFLAQRLREIGLLA